MKPNKVIEKPTGFAHKFVRKPGVNKDVTHYCPGCGHGRIHKLIAEAMQNLEISDKTIFISPVGCSVFGFYYFDCGNIQAAHGRAPAVGTGAAHGNPGSIVISYQGDGDLAAIGTAEIIHAANRGENMTVIFVNNGIYGMTGSQMAPTTLPGAKTTTTPYGRDVAEHGYPIKVCEMISTLDAPVYIERVSVTDTKNIMKTKRAITKALKSQMDQKGFSLVEILASCPTGWKMTPCDSIDYMHETMEKYFPMKVFKDEIKERPSKNLVERVPTDEEVISALAIGDRPRLFEVAPDYTTNFKEQRIRIAGFGGQGVLMAGTTLAYLGMEHDLDVTWLPSYGPEMRGGTANCHVVLSNQQIGTPMVNTPDCLIAMNGPSYTEFEPTVRKGGLVIVNSSIITQQATRSDLTTLYVPLTELAESAGIKAAANMAAVAAYLTYTDLMSLDNLIAFLKTNFKKPALLDKNVDTIYKARDYVLENYSH
ncbi:MAG: 2-ketoisovalerate ferredoxin oxidoreductase [Bdellovibrionales bacterium]|jgi:2-oxoisovalerate ferredoxin oxidoreductase beta subunit|nr:2-ketoisovalerate ferredoxin oxidoreductase [Bdellovibrionales bacterium]MBT3525940.1 2-ketoisovalerate ferredoxin oxidoreductase [Bdellovibrionales bacterium]MBT7668800.1 2-ketoisovalerate ferredoxin oxidoreductase [Bdellovibrionales bacterium]MBT7767077.1 2-ketoisovalerate ferredoxin oxidoreductase [Bdellovibrionales bacterium]